MQNYENRICTLLNATVDFFRLIFISMVVCLFALLPAGFLFMLPVLIALIPLLLFVVVISFFEDPDGKVGFVAAFAGGFVLEMYSSYPFGFYLVPLLVLVWLAKFAFKNYVTFSYKIR